MAQRVYLIPTPGGVRDLFEEAVLSQAPADFENVIARLEARAARHQRVNDASKRNAKRLDVAQLMDIVFEAVLFASRAGLGLVEADEAVGAYGFR